MAKRSISNDEIALIKAMLARGIANKDIQFYFNRQDRAVNSGRITNIRDGTYSDSADIEAADAPTLNAFLSTFSRADVGAIVEMKTVGPQSPICREAILAMFVEGGDQVWRLLDGESDTRECKQGFGLRHSHQWVKAIAALANNRGGHVFFGVADGGHKGAGGQDLSYAVVGLGTDEFTKIDPAEITNKLRSMLDPTPRIEIAVHNVGGTTIGVIHVAQHPSRPIIAQKADGDRIKEGDIFYRYPGQSVRIKYSDLRTMLDERDQQARLEVMPMVERLLALGPGRALVADLDQGVLDGAQGRIVIDADLVERIKFIRDGEFNEVEGAPTLKLVGEVVPVGHDDIRSRGVITDDIVLRNFLKRETVSQPKEYIRYAAVGGHAAWLPIGYFASAANLSRAEVKRLISDLPGETSRKRTLLARIDLADPARKAFQGSPKRLVKDLAAGKNMAPSDAKAATAIAQAICGLNGPGSLTADSLLDLLGACLAAINAEGKSASLSYVRRAACRIDEMFYPLVGEAGAIQRDEQGAALATPACYAYAPNVAFPSASR